MSTHDDLPPLPGSTSAFSLTGSIYTADDMRDYARAALAQRVVPVAVSYFPNHIELGDHEARRKWIEQQAKL